MKERNRIYTMVFPYLIGALIGAGIALLMAPQSGPETRSLIRGKGVEIKDRAVETVEDTRSRAGKAIDDLTHQTKENVSSLIGRGKEAIEDQKENLREGMKSA